MGFLSAGKGVVVHRVNCRNVREFRKHPDHCIDVTWAPIHRGMYEVALHILAKNIPGVLANISSSISEAGSNIEQKSAAPIQSRIGQAAFHHQRKRP